MHMQFCPISTIWTRSVLLPQPSLLLMEIGRQKPCCWFLSSLISQHEKIPITLDQVFLISSSPSSNIAHSEADLMEDSSIIMGSGPLLHFQRCKAIILSLCWEIMKMSSVQAFKPKLAHCSCLLLLHCSMDVPEGRQDGSHLLCLISSVPEDPLPLTLYMHQAILRR